MSKLLLFDIDGTLITSKRADRFSRAIHKVHALHIDSDKDFSGYTDYLILDALLKEKGWTDIQVKESMPKLIKELDRVHAETFQPDDVELLPGTRELIAKLKDRDHQLGLITGNIKGTARRKLEAAGIWSSFSLGGFGDDPHSIRADLVKVAIKRAGYEEDLEDVFVFGDTARDIEAAHTAGVMNSVGVANGYRDIKELVDAGAKYVFEDCKDTNAVMRTLGLN